TISDNNKNPFRFKMIDSLQIIKREKHWLEFEYEILQKISMCIWRREIAEERLQLEIANFQNISKTSNHKDFKDLVSNINSENYNKEKALELIGLLEYYLEDETKKIGINIGNNLYETK